MRRAFAGLAALLMVAVVLQFFLAGSGAFDTAPNDEAFRPHRMLGYGIVLIAVVLTVVAALVRTPGRLIGLSGLVVGLAIAQPVIAAIAKAFGDSGQTTTAGQVVLGLHAVVGVGILLVVRTILRQARESTATVPSGSGEGSPAAEPSAGSSRSAS